MCDTKTYEEFVRSLMGSHLNERACYALGLAGEAGEVCGELLGGISYASARQDKLEKELGDVCWYVVALGLQFRLAPEVLWRMADDGVKYNDLPHVHDLGLLLARDAGAAVDRLKKHWGHKKELNVGALASDLARVLTDVIYIADAAGLTLHDVRSANVAKLSARFPDGRFSTQAANAYADRNIARADVSLDDCPPTQRAVPSPIVARDFTDLGSAS